MSEHQRFSASRPARRTRRLRFRAVEGEVELVAQERVEMICPPSVGDPPKAGVHGGAWVELRDGNGELVFFQTLHDPFGTSVEIHEPDGTIRREFGPPSESVFEVLVPDEVDASTLVLMGERPSPRTARGRRRKDGTPSGAEELARFDLDADGSAS